MLKNNRFSQKISVFHGLYLPEPEVYLVGYSAIICAHDLQVPLPDVLSAISHKHKEYQKDRWTMFTPRYQPDNTLFAHLTFALKHEGINLSVLRALFDIIDAKEISHIIQLEPMGIYSRKIWFLYEWLLDTKLDLPDVTEGNYVDVLDIKLQYGSSAKRIKRQRIRNNLPGTPAFCPTIRKTKRLTQFLDENLGQQAQKYMHAVHPDILMRAAAFMLLKDSKASYAIEGETPPQTRAERWANAIGQAGTHALSHDEFIGLQEIVIADFRFVHYGYRNEGGFVGEHERGTGLPIPEHISAPAKDLIALMDGLIQTNQLLKESDFDPVLAAAIIAFGFVFIHPFEDGNGRIHRYLIHHVLAEKDFTPRDIAFPISSAILANIGKYSAVLAAHSKPRLPFIQWCPTPQGNVEVLNETIDLYRYFDATKHAEFLYECVQETIQKILPEEIIYLNRYNAMKNFIVNYIDFPDRLIDLLIRFLIQNNGKFSNRARQKEFRHLTEEEILVLENKFAEIFMP